MNLTTDRWFPIKTGVLYNIMMKNKYKKQYFLLFPLVIIGASSTFILTVQATMMTFIGKRKRSKHITSAVNEDYLYKLLHNNSKATYDRVGAKKAATSINQ